MTFKQIIENQQLRFAILAVCVAIACYLFWDWIVENLLLSLLGLGGAAIAAKKQSAKEAIAASDEHEALMSQSVGESVKEMMKADELREKAVNTAKSVDKMPDKPVAGKKRKTFTSR